MKNSEIVLYLPAAYFTAVIVWHSVILTLSDSLTQRSWHCSYYKITACPELEETHRDH